jgi:RNA polymerase primary sigma factor
MKKLTISQGLYTIVNTNSFETYLRELSAINVLSAEEEIALTKRIALGDKKALDKLIKHNLRFVVSVAKQFVDKDNNIEDLVNEGNLGLIIAANKFDPDRGIKFISYAVWYIRKQMMLYKGTITPTIKITSNKQNDLYKYKTIKNKLEMELEREPSTSEINEVLQHKNIREIEFLYRNYVESLSKPLDNEYDNGELIDTIESLEKEIQSDYSLIKKERDEHYTKIFECLTERECYVIKHLFGIDADLYSVSGVAYSLGISNEGVRFIKQKALRKLRNNIKNRSYLEVLSF